MAGSDTPRKYRKVPPGFTEGGATPSELQAAGFQRGNQGESRAEQPAQGSGGARYEVVRDPEGHLRQARFRVLRDPDARIVATWGEDRWWTPDEFNQRFLTNRGEQQPNRAARRRRSIRDG